MSLALATLVVGVCLLGISLSPTAPVRATASGAQAVKVNLRPSREVTPAGPEMLEGLWASAKRFAGRLLGGWLPSAAMVLPPPIHHYTFDNPANPGEDTAGSLHGTLLNGATRTKDNVRVGTGALLFDENPSDERVQLGGSSTDTTWTVAMWVRRAQDASSTAAVLMDGATNNTPNLSLRSEIGNFPPATGNEYGWVLWDDTISNVVYATPLTIGAWTHLSFVCNGANIGVYENGVFLGSITGSNTRVIPLGSIGASALSGVMSHVGEMDDIIVYDQNLTAAQVSELYATYVGAGTIAGSVYRDHNADGVDNGAGEPGVGAVTVTAYDSLGGSVSATTASTGAYSLSVATLAAGPYRVEFTNVPAGAYTGPQGGGSNTTVQYVSAPATNVDLGISFPWQYCQSNPSMATNCYQQGRQDVAPVSTRDVIISFPYNAGATGNSLIPGGASPAHGVLAKGGQTGPTFGLAYQRATRSLYAAAFMKRHVAFGPNGPGAIYRIDRNTNAVSLFTTLSGVGADPHPVGTNFDRDPNSWDQVGKMSLGDLEISDDEQSLWTINLSSRELVKIPLLAGPAAGTPVTYPVPTPAGCVAGDARPFAVGFNDGKAYVGVTCTAESTQNAADMKGVVYSFDPGTTTFTQVLSFPLNYPRTCAVQNGGCTPAAWKPWKTTFTVINSAFNGEYIYPQPWLSDIVFDNDNMILGIRDRFGDQTGYRQLSTNAADPKLYTGDVAGDILRACGDPTSGWTLESNGRCSGNGTGPQNNGAGPGNAEFYFRDNYPAHHEISMGGVAQVPGFPEVVFTVYDPLFTLNEYFDGGILWLNNTTGDRVRAYRAYSTDVGDPGTFAKGGGLGDLEALCEMAPVEVGNRIWLDVDCNGVQDANEPALANVQVQLYDSANALLATATTDANGNYFFSNHTGTNTASKKYGLSGLVKNTAGYQVRVATGQAALNSKVLTTANNDPGANGDSRDSDATLSGATAIVTFNTGGAGENNHTYDIGFQPVPTLNIGNLVWKDLDGDGVVDTGEPGVAGVKVVLYSSTDAVFDAGDTMLSMQNTNASGYYSFSNLTPGNYFVRVDPTNFGGVLANCASSTGNVTSDSDTNNADHGVDNGAPATNGIVSTVITLAQNTEPDVAVDDDGINGNQTIDFGFVPQIALGNLVWKDLNGNSVKDAAEPGIEAVTVQLYRDNAPLGTFDAGDTLTATTATDVNGFYGFSLTSAQAGDYFVHIPQSNFTGAGVLAGCLSSPNHVPANDDLDNDDSGQDNPTPTAGGITSTLVTLSVGGEPPAGVDGDGTNNNETVDFGFIPQMTIGNFVWKDKNNNGVFDTGEPPVQNVQLQLFADTNDSNAYESGTDLAVAGQPIKVTDTNGLYTFTGLLPGKYFVKVLASNFDTAAPGALAGCVSSSGHIPVNNDVDNDDSGVDDNAPATNGIVSSVITLVYHQEPDTADDTDNTDGNLTADFGFTPIMNLGNLVWKDYDGDGVYDTASPVEPPIQNVKVSLFKDINGNDAFDSGTDTQVGATVMTDVNGLYNFTGLLPGKYFVRVDASNFQSGGALVGCTSSLGAQDPNVNVTDSLDTGVDDGDPATNAIFSPVVTLVGFSEPDTPADTNGTNGDLTVDFGFIPKMSLGNLVWKDYDNDGLKDVVEPGIQGVEVHLYLDADNNGSFDPSLDRNIGITTTGVGGVYSFTDLSPGKYFVHIPALNFQPLGKLEGCLSSTPNDTGQTTDNNDNGTTVTDPITLDTAPAITGIASNLITLVGFSEPPVGTDGDDNNGNQTIDFGFFTPFSIGNTVWFDTNNDGQIQATETGKDGVLVELFFDADNSGTLTGAEQTPVARQLTSGGGYYLFTQQTDAAGVGTGSHIGGGRYFVGVSPYNFDTGLVGAPATIGGTAFVAGMLKGYLSSVTTISNAGVITDGTLVANTDLNGDNADDGLKQSAASANNFYLSGSIYGVMSGALILKENDEPVTETTLPASLGGGATPPNNAATPYPNGHFNTVDGTAAGLAIRDQDSNVTVDFGFYTQKLGDLVFSDDGGGVTANYNNGLKNAGENGLPGVTLKLYAQDGTTELAAGPDGILGTTDDITGATNIQTTLAVGTYEFCGLPEGQYVVKATLPAGYKSSADVAGQTATPNGNHNDDDNGVGTASGTVASNPITLTPGAAGALNNNTVTGGTATTENPTLDFGAAPEGFSIGNVVFYDQNNDGMIDPMEKGIDGVRVELFLDADNSGALNTVGEQTPIAVQLTTSGGYYLFTQTTDANGVGTGVPLQPGQYFIGIAPSNFAANAVLAGLHSSGTTASAAGAPGDAPIVANGTTDSNTDNKDDGIKNTAGFYLGGVLSGLLDLDPGQEPSLETTAGMPGDTNGNTPGHPNTTNGQAGGPPILDFNSNITVDFGFYAASLGNLIWHDDGSGTGGVYNDGLQNGSEPGIAGVTVKLFAEDGTTQLAAKLTDANGKYLFPNLPQGKYFIEVDRTSGPLAGMTSSKDPANAGTPNAADNDDNGVLAALTTTAVRSMQLMLVPGSAPTGESDQAASGCCGAGSGGFGNPVMRDSALVPDNDSNLHVDFSFVRYYSLGNRVWRDLDNDGTINAGDGASPGIDMVEVRLLTSPGLTPATDLNGAPIANQMTSGGGYYRFDNLAKGDYVLEVVASNFTGAGKLVGHVSSGPDGGDGDASDDPDVDVDDNDDNGIGGVFNATNGIRSDAVTLGEGAGTAEPTTDNDPAPNPNTAAGEAPNNQSNRTVDFGFVRYYSLGNRVWRDLNNDGCLDPGDGATPGIPGVVVRLLDGTGAPANDIFGNPMANQTTDANGYFRFDNLLGANPSDPASGQYILEIVSSNFSGALAGYASSGGGAGNPFEPAPDPDNDDDNKDSGTHTGAPGITAVRSLPVTLGEGTGVAEPTGDGDPVTNPDSANGEAPNNQSNRTVDFGFTPYWTLGNRVWKDLDNSGTINGADGASPGVNSVSVALLDGAGQPARNLYGQPVLNALTQNGGYYRFDLLAPGDYIVEIPADEFLAGKPLFAHASSSGAPNSLTGPYESSAPDPDNPAANGGIDSDDNGQRQPNGAVRSSAITLGPWGTPEFLGETDRQSPNPAAESTDDRTNLTLDFGFVAGLSLGNLVWKDLDDDGVHDNGEPAVQGVVVELYADANLNQTLDVGAGDTLIGTSTTNLNGVYGFIGLIPGNYFVRVAPSNFTGSGALLNCASSSVDDATPNNDEDDDDNGIQNAAPQTNGIASGLVTLAVGAEPDGNTNPKTDGDSDPNTNLTIDFGFTSTGLSLGNLVWKDLDNDGFHDPTEPGIPSVQMRLYKDANNNTTFEPGTDLEVAGVSPQSTNGTGNYLFSGLLPGTYYVAVDPTNFAGAGALAGCASSTVTDGNANNDEDNDDNGSDAPAVVSSFVVLQTGAEPDVPQDGDGKDSNLTVDFGFYAPLSLGNLVWKDYDNDGAYEPGAGETGVNGVLVELYRETNATPGLQIPGDAFVTSQMTGGGGGYNFTGLLPGDYYVFLPASNFTGALAGCVTSTPTQPDPNQPVVTGGTDGDDNGMPGPNGGIVTGLINLNGGTEPTNDGDGPNSNQTVDLGFYSPVNLGNFVWKDSNNNGLYEPGLGEQGVNGVTVELFRDNGNGVFDLAGDQSLGAQQTVNGAYNFTNLAPGNYFVRVNAENFQQNGALTGCVSSATTAADPNNPGGGTDNDDNGIDDQTPALTGIVSGLVSLAGNAEPTNDGDGPNGNLTLDFGFYPQLTLGNLIWKDYDNDGQKDAAEPGIAGVRLDLYKDNGDHALNPVNDTLVAQQVSDNNGNYSFTGLTPGDYFVRVSAVNFAANGALFNCNSSTPTQADPDVLNGGTDNDDNGINDPNPAANGVVSGEITLSGNTEPANDGDGPNGNLTLDFGFYAPLNLGNLVWKDLDNDGLKDPAEPGIDGVVVQLYSDNGATPGAYDVTDTAVGAPQTTAGGGLYNFAGLTPGAYLVRVMPSNFVGAGALAGCNSSTVTDPTTDNNEDNDDNGVDNPAPGTNGIASNAINLSGNEEPDTPADGDGKNGNLTLDFGFYAPVSLGNFIWKDYNNNSQVDAGEPGVGNVTLELWRETNGTPGLQTTGGTPDTHALPDVQSSSVPATLGQYQFTGLLPGDYYVRVPAAEFQSGGDLVGCQSSTVNDPTPNNNEDNDDNGIENGDPSVNGVVTNAITLIGGEEPPANVDGNDPNGNNTLDLGFYAPLNLGNVIWKDYNNDGVQQTSGPNVEPGVNGVTVELYRDNGDGVFGSGDPFVTSTTTATAGSVAGVYNFPNLVPGSYLVKVPAAEFQSGGDLAGCLSSTVTDANPNDNDDNDDNGVDNPAPQTNGIVTNAITLTGAAEPDTAADGDGTNGNLTLDLGFIPQMSLGNLVWKDFDNDGLYEPPTEAGINGVLVELYKDTNNNNAFDAATDQKVSEQLTQTVSGVAGAYNFTNLAPGVYFARLAPQNFAQAGALAGCLSTQGVDAGDQTDNNDNGVDGGNPSANGVVTNPIPLIGNSEPANDGDGPNSNQTIDFGVYAPVNLGNQVWKDNNNNGLKEANEPGVDGVVIELFKDAPGAGAGTIGSEDGPAVATQTTSGGGYYNFANLSPGQYIARIPASNFDNTGDPLAGCLSSEPTAADPNTPGNLGGTDGDDNGLNNSSPQTNGITSGVVDLLGGAEPEAAVDGDGKNGNLTLDFGFIPQMTIGNLVWKDLNNDGQFQAGEPGVANVTLNVYRETGQAAGLQLTGANADTLAGTTTSAASGVIGSYQFTGLVPGTYYVAIPAAEFASGDLVGCLSSEPTGADPNTDKDSDDNGVDNPAPQTNGIATGGITLTGGGEPSADGDGPNGNNTIDFGFIPQMSLGNVIWKDNNNDGIWQSSGAYTEPAVNNVTVELIRDLNANGQPDDAVYRTTTTAGGVYNFANLPPGNYFVRVPAAEFATGGDLAGCLSSTVTAADPNNPNGGADHDDDGLDNPTPQTNGIVTSLISLAGNSEPANDGDGPNGNQTIDLGFYPPMTLGNRVWKDLNNDGLLNNNEPGAPNVTVELWRETNGNTTLDVAGTLPDTLAASQVTNGNGDYNFANLTPGTYYVRIAPQEFQPNGDLYTCVSSTTTVADPNNPGGGVDNDDNGVDTPAPQTTGIASNAVVLVGGTEPTTDGDGPNGNNTVDFGFYTPLSVGNLVWKDNNNNGLKDATEPGVANVRVELFRDNGNSVFDPAADSQIGFTTTNANGEYRFDNLTPGAYFVLVAQSNFAGSGALTGCLSSTVTAPDPNDPANVGGVDHNDDGVDSSTPQTTGIVTKAINLSGGTEPDAPVDGDGPNSNLTIDFGFYPPMSLGNLVWKDTNNNGLKDASESGVANVVVELWRDNGNGTFDPGTDTQVTPNQTTNASGIYQFTNLLPGDYFVRVAASNFAAGGALADCGPSASSNPNPNDDKDNDNNAVSTPNGVVTGKITLTGNSEPPQQTDGDGPNGNQTVDLGFTTGGMTLGNMVWKDTNANGLREAAEPGIPNVKLSLYRDNGDKTFNKASDTLVGGTMTNAGGVYAFTGLSPADYFIEVDASNFGASGALAACVSTVGAEPPNNDVDNDDNGSNAANPAANPPASGVISLVQNGEPDNDGDGKNGNLTVDFGFVGALSVTIEDPISCVGPGTVLNVRAEMLNVGGGVQQNNAGPEMLIALPATLAAVPGSASAQGGTGAVTIVNPQRIEWSGSLQPGERVVVTYRVQVAASALSGAELCIPSTANFDADLNGTNETAITINTCVTADCLPIGPGLQTNPGASVLFFPVYTSSPSNPNLQNTRISLTNANPEKEQPVHLFFVDGATCSVSDQYLCLTPNQTTSFVMSDLDPGVTGYAIAVAVNRFGCPVASNFLLGDEYVKFESGHAASLKAEGAVALPGGLPACQVGSSTAVLKFDGVSYSPLSRVVASSSLFDRASGNDAMLILNRLSGSAATGMDPLGSVFGILYDDAESAFSFSFTPSSCQFRSTLSNNFPRTTPRFEQAIAAGRTGWLRLWSQSDAPITGAVINRNPNAASSSQAYNQGHSLHTLTTTSAGSLTIPVFPPSC